ncbi:uncharacterized protein TrAFT101_008929 [Trichoderma asperellum]|uniref:uncharacterized protein n=1 Tax=Trichoderma asperellum TaxID=101201 RepID=UPI003330BC46|nr:hypothetical protein TrAFT101_008929 [Trichoderma asperellum]
MLTPCSYKQGRRNLENRGLQYSHLAAAALQLTTTQLILRSPGLFKPAQQYCAAAPLHGGPCLCRNLPRRLWLRHAAAEAGDQNLVVYSASPLKAPQSFWAHQLFLFYVPLRL